MIPSRNGNRYLVAYATNSGSTAEIARAIGEELARTGVTADVLRVEDVDSLEKYSAVVVGGPMMVGWHRTAMGFVKRHQQALSRIRVAYFFPAMSLTEPEDGSVGPVPVYVDAALAKPPRNPAHPSIPERYATIPNYLNPVLKAAPQVLPVSAAFFAGKIDLSVLGLLQRLFVLWIIRARPADRRNWKAIRGWAASLRMQFLESGTA